MSGSCTSRDRIKAVVMGVSAGGLEALKTVLPALKKDFPAPVLIVQHQSPNAGDYLARRLDEICNIEVLEAEDKDIAEPGKAYIAPPNYHLLVDEGGVLRLSVDPRVNFARPSVDVLFETAAEVYRSGLAGVIMTGANNDGAHGLRVVKDCGGVAVVQAPRKAEAGTMPGAALELVPEANVLPLDKIGNFLNNLADEKE